MPEDPNISDDEPTTEDVEPTQGAAPADATDEVDGDAADRPAADGTDSAGEPTDETAADGTGDGDAAGGTDSAGEPTDETAADGTGDGDAAGGDDSPEYEADPEPEPEHVMTQEEMQAAVTAAEQRAADAEARAQGAETMQRIAEGERDAANEARDRAQRLTTLAAGLVGQAGMYAVASAIVMADDTHYALVDEIGDVEDKLVQFSELFDGLVAEGAPDAIGKAMDVQKYVSSIMDMGDAGVSAL